MWLNERQLLSPTNKRKCAFATDGYGKAYREIRQKHRFSPSSPWDFAKFLRLQCRYSSLPYPRWARKWLNVRKEFSSFYSVQRCGIDSNNVDLMTMDWSVVFDRHWQDAAQPWNELRWSASLRSWRFNKYCADCLGIDQGLFSLYIYIYFIDIYPLKYSPPSHFDCCTLWLWILFRMAVFYCWTMVFVRAIQSFWIWIVAMVPYKQIMFKLTTTKTTTNIMKTNSTKIVKISNASLVSDCLLFFCLSLTLSRLVLSSTL